MTIQTTAEEEQPFETGVAVDLMCESTLPTLATRSGTDIVHNMCVTPSLKAAITVAGEHPTVCIYAYGEKPEVDRTLSFLGINRKALPRNLKFWEAPAYPMDKEPIGTMENDRGTSMAKALERLKRSHFRCAAISSGNTAALTLLSTLIVGRVDKGAYPALAVCLPSKYGDDAGPAFTLMVDAGITDIFKATEVATFARLAVPYWKYLTERASDPTVAKLTKGSESWKGGPEHKAAFELLARDHGDHFLGNIEATSLLAGKTDIAVCDGASGNAALKSMEGTATEIREAMHTEVAGLPILNRAICYPMKKVIKPIVHHFDPTRFGPARILNLKYPVYKLHGSAGETEWTRGIQEAVIAALNEPVRTAAG